MFRCFALFTFLLHSSSLFAALERKSAHREPWQSYLEFKARASRPETENIIAPLRTAQGVAAPFGNAKLADATRWESEPIMNQRFLDLRDIRTLQTGDHPGFLRRIS